MRLSSTARFLPFLPDATRHFPTQFAAFQLGHLTTWQLGRLTGFTRRFPSNSGTFRRLPIFSRTARPPNEAQKIQKGTQQLVEIKLRLMAVELEGLGYTALTGTGGVNGPRLAREKVPDLIVSDINKMPAEAGKLRAAGFDACVSKPADTEEICALVQKLTSRIRSIGLCPPKLLPTFGLVPPPHMHHPIPAQDC